MRVIVTRPASQAGKWVTDLRAAGLDALSLPLIEIAGPPDPQTVHQAWLGLEQFNALMFVSANAVQHFFALRPPSFAWDGLTGNPAPRCFVTGPGSLAALLRAGVPRECIEAPGADTAQFDSEALWLRVQAQVLPGWRVLIVRGNSDSENGDEPATAQGVGRNWFAERLAERGASVEFLVAYARRAPQLPGHALALLKAAARDGTVWLFSSSEAVSNLCHMAPDLAWERARAVATHPRIAQAARDAGFGHVRESRPAVEDLVASIESLA